MKDPFIKLLKLSQSSTFFWPLMTSICLGWLVSSDHAILARIGSSLGIICLLMAIFSFGSIEDAPIDALAETKKPGNPISKGYVSIPSAWKICLVLVFIGLLLSLLISPGTVLIVLSLLFVGVLYFHHSLKLRQNIFLDALGFSIITSLFPFLLTVNTIPNHLGIDSLVTGILAFFLTYATYFTMIRARDKNLASDLGSPKPTPGVMIVLVVIMISTLVTFTLTGLVPAWVSALMAVLFVIMVNPQFSKRAVVQTETFTHILLAIYQRVLVIALATYYLSTQIFSILR